MAHNYTKPSEVSRELYDLAQELRHIDNNRCVATDVAEALDSIRSKLDAYIGADDNELPDEE